MAANEIPSYTYLDYVLNASHTRWACVCVQQDGFVSKKNSLKFRHLSALIFPNFIFSWITRSYVVCIFSSLGASFFSFQSRCDNVNCQSAKPSSEWWKPFTFHRNALQKVEKRNEWYASFIHSFEDSSNFFFYSLELVPIFFSTLIQIQQLNY